MITTGEAECGILFCTTFGNTTTAPRVGPTIDSIIAQKLPTVTPAHRGEPSENAQLSHEHHSGVNYC